MTERLAGRVAMMSYDRGFFFIRTNSGISFFAHESDLPRGDFAKLNQGDHVTFAEVLPSPPKGRRACVVELDPDEAAI
jgi:cold shock CspA family protein